MTWEEHCGFTPPPQEEGDRLGFGTKLAESSARQLQGRIERHFAIHGLVLQLVFPLSTRGPEVPGEEG